MTNSTSRSGANADDGRRAADTRLAEFAESFLDALIAGDRIRAEKIVGHALATGVEPETIHVRVIGRAMERVGELWEVDRLTVADEHLATAIGHQVLMKLIDPLQVAPFHSRENVLLAAVQGQQHVLGLRMIADVLEGAGFNVLYLGADVPVEALAKFAAEHRPAVTGLSYSIAVDIGVLADSVFAVREATPETRLMLGGRAAPRDLSASGFPWVSGSSTVLPSIEKLLRSEPQEIPPLFHALRARSNDRPIGGEGAAVDESVDTTEARLAQIAAESAEISREYARRAETYRELSLRDPVTGLANRRAFDDRLHTHVVKRPDSGALLMIDVDNFKEFNDERGHDAGDQVLKTVGWAIEESIRPKDFSARIGGDEFAVLLPSGTLEDARNVGDRIRSVVARRGDGAVTVSIGGARITRGARETLMAADKALYGAKAAGRDTVATDAGNSADDGGGDNGRVPGAPPAYVSMSRLKLPEDRAPELVAAFRDRAGLVDGADGFLGLEVWQSDRDAGEVLMVSHWRDRDAFKTYMKSGAHKISHDRIDPALKDAIKLMALEHMHTYEVVAE